MWPTGASRSLGQEQIHDVLRNERRQRVLKRLKRTMGPLTVRSLAESIAEVESGESPPPRDVRRSVYNSLHQTHLPKLDSLDLVHYDRDRKTVSIQPEFRQVDLYMEVVTPYSITWSEYYQLSMLLSLIVIAAAEMGVPLLSAVSPLVLSSLFLAFLGLSTAHQLWQRRWFYLQQFVS